GLFQVLLDLEEPGAGAADIEGRADEDLGDDHGCGREPDAYADGVERIAEDTGAAEGRKQGDTGDGGRQDDREVDEGVDDPREAAAMAGEDEGGRRADQHD